MPALRAWRSLLHSFDCNLRRNAHDAFVVASSERPDVRSQFNSLLYQLLLDPSERVCFEAIFCVLGKADNSERYAWNVHNFFLNQLLFSTGCDFLSTSSNYLLLRRLNFLSFIIGLRKELLGGIVWVEKYSSFLMQLLLRIPVLRQKMQFLRSPSKINLRSLGDHSH